jgi:thymidylate synthase ThyX
MMNSTADFVVMMLVEWDGLDRFMESAKTMSRRDDKALNKLCDKYDEDYYEAEEEVMEIIQKKIEKLRKAKISEKPH